MNLLVQIPLYLIIGCAEWFLAIRRTVACARGETAILVTIVFIENIISLWVLSRFIMTNDWGIAVAYSIGGSLGSWMVMKANNKKIKKENKDITE